MESTPTYLDGVNHKFSNGDPRYLDPAYHTPERLLFLNGMMQSQSSGASAYHEALVHPAMFVHPSPSHVGIVGGGDGATLREVLKHNTVDHVTIVGIDEELIQIAREHLSEMSDCSDLYGRATNCFDDETVEFFLENSLQWFVEHYGPGVTKTAPNAHFDVIIFDAQYQDYADADMVAAILKSLTDSGVFIMHVGNTPDLSDPKADIGNVKTREKLFNLFENHSDVASMLVYEEANSGHLEPHSYMVLCKDVSCRSRWNARSDVIDFEVFRRIVKTISGERALHFFDGTTQQSYQCPPMAWEAVYCRREPTPFECAYRSLNFTRNIFETDLVNPEKSAFAIELTVTDADVTTTSSMFAKVDIPRGSYIMPDHLAKSLKLSKYNVIDIRESAAEGALGLQDFATYVEKHARSAQHDGAGALYLEVGASALIRVVDDESEANVGRWVPIHPNGERPAYSPVYDRHRVSLEVFLVATQDVPAGAELTRHT